MKVSLGFVALAGCLSTFSVLAAGPSQSDLFKALAECQASAQQVAEFNGLVDAGQLSLPKDVPHSPWGGGAWQVTPALTVHGVSSTTAVMTDRASFFLQAKSSSPKADAEQIASKLELKKSWIPTVMSTSSAASTTAQPCEWFPRKTRTAISTWVAAISRTLPDTRQ